MHESLQILIPEIVDSRPLNLSQSPPTANHGYFIIS